MPSGRTPRPAQLKAVNGRRPGKDSGGRDINDPGFTPVADMMDPPEDLSEDACGLWNKIVPEFARLGLLRELDADALRSCCESYGKWREAVRMRHAYGLVSETAQGYGVAPWVKVEESSSREFRQWCDHFGLTPAAATKLPTGNKHTSGGEPFSDVG